MTTKVTKNTKSPRDFPSLRQDYSPAKRAFNLTTDAPRIPDPLVSLVSLVVHLN
ncbi:MAG: hypothetical protein JWP35_3496 [Caulobacter sp.]|nr:hypothetical protein [Caulobacter sp.]